MYNLPGKEYILFGPSMPLLNSGNWNPALHPRDFHGEFRYNGGRHHHVKPAKTGGENALHNAILKLKIDKKYINKDSKKANPNGIYITHYGPGTKIGGWDHNNDSNTNKGLGKRNIKLNALSLAVSNDVAQAAGLKLGGPVYVNGQYIGNYDDSPGENGRIDIYDHDNSVGRNWAGMVWGGVVTSHP